MQVVAKAEFTRHTVVYGTANDNRRLPARNSLASRSRSIDLINNQTQQINLFDAHFAPVAVVLAYEGCAT